MQSKPFGAVNNTIIATSSPAQQLQMVKNTITEATDWSMEVAIGLFSSVTFFCVLAYFFRKVD